jgi:hypothetical protein
MTIHSDAIHNRAKAARAEANLAATKLQQALLEWLATTCPTEAAPEAAIYASQLKNFSPASNFPDPTPEYRKFMAVLGVGEKSPRGADIEFHAAHAAALQLTLAAQTVEYRATLP